MQFSESIHTSVILPVYKNALTLRELHQRLSTILERSEGSYEIIFVDDCCPENSISILREITAVDSHSVALTLKQNGGQQRALLAGLSEARGDVVIMMDADLQDPPEAIPELMAILDQGYEVVFAGRRGRYQQGRRLFTSRIYKTILHLLTGAPKDAGLFMAVRRRVITDLLEMDTEPPHLVAMIGALGPRMVSIPVERSLRPSGESAYTAWMRLKAGLKATFWAAGWKLGKRAAQIKKHTPAATIREKIGARYQNPCSEE